MSSPETELASTLILDFPAFRMVRNKCLLFIGLKVSCPPRPSHPSFRLDHVSTCTAFRSSGPYSICGVLKSYLLIFFFKKKREEGKEREIKLLLYLLLHSLVDCCVCPDWGSKCNLGVLGGCSNQLSYSGGVHLECFKNAQRTVFT